jgi:hypothetical protein
LQIGQPIREKAGGAPLYSSTPQEQRIFIVSPYFRFVRCFTPPDFFDPGDLGGL